MLGNIDLSRQILANSEMGLLSSFLNSFKKLVGMLAGPNAFLAFSELIIDVTSSSFVALNVKVSFQQVLKDNSKNANLVQLILLRFL